jgi:hypothetical protein
LRREMRFLASSWGLSATGQDHDAYQ